jgi:hypothetical protein
MRLLLVLLLATAAVASAAPLPFPKKSDRPGEGDPSGLKAIQGVWVVTRFSGLETNVELDGPEGPCLLAYVSGTTVEFHTRDREVKPYNVSLLTTRPAVAAGKARLGVYRLDRGLLLIALVPPGTSPPVKFEDVARSGTVWVMRRLKAP